MIPISEWRQSVSSRGSRSLQFSVEQLWTMVGVVMVVIILRVHNN